MIWLIVLFFAEFSFLTITTVKVKLIVSNDIFRGMALTFVASWCIGLGFTAIKHAPDEWIPWVMAFSTALGYGFGMIINRRINPKNEEN